MTPEEILMLAKAGNYTQINTWYFELNAATKQKLDAQIFTLADKTNPWGWTMLDYTYYAAKHLNDQQAQFTLRWLSTHNITNYYERFIALEQYTQDAPPPKAIWDSFVHIYKNTPGLNPYNNRHPQQWSILNYALYFQNTDAILALNPVLNGKLDHNISFTHSIAEAIFWAADPHNACWEQVFFAIEQKLIPPHASFTNKSEKWTLLDCVHSLAKIKPQKAQEIKDKLLKYQSNKGLSKPSLSTPSTSYKKVLDPNASTWTPSRNVKKVHVHANQAPLADVTNKRKSKHGKQ